MHYKKLKEKENRRFLFTEIHTAMQSPSSFAIAFILLNIIYAIILGNFVNVFNPVSYMHGLNGVSGWIILFIILSVAVCALNILTSREERKIRIAIAQDDSFENYINNIL